MIRARLGAAIVAGSLALTGCGSGDDAAPDASTTTTTAARARPSPTSVPDGGDEPGAVIDAELLDAPGIDGTVWRVRYRSTSVGGEPVQVTGIVARPEGEAPGGHPVLAFAHGTSGVADECAPSAAGADGVLGLQVMLDAGYVVAATDYEGLGTPGVHPYLVSASEGRSLLDGVRAARHLVPDASDSVVSLGVSQGGHAVLAASEIVEQWAPELDLVGTVAVAPAADLGIIVPATFRPSPTFGFAVLVAAGWADAYEELSEEDVLGPSGLQVAVAAREGSCVGEVFAEAALAEQDGLVKTPPHELPAWSRRIEENTIHPDRVTGPVMLVQGTADVVVPQQLTDLLARTFCDAGVEVRYETYEGADHGGAVIAAFDDIRRWGEDRLADRPPDVTC